MKRIIMLLAALLLTCSAAYAAPFTEPSLGISVEVPEGVTVEYVPLNELSGIGFADFLIGEKEAALFIAAKEAMFESAFGSPEAFSKMENCSAETRNGYVFALCLTPENIPAEDMNRLTECLNAAQYSDPQPASIAGAVSLHTVNAAGEPVDESIFAEYDLTMVNIWATWCNPCLNEMPVLADMLAALPENQNMLLLCDNVTSLDDAHGMDIIRTVAERAGLPLGNILLSDANGGTDALLNLITAYPTTFFVNGAGELTGNPVVGARPDEYRAAMAQ